MALLQPEGIRNLPTARNAGLRAALATPKGGVELASHLATLG